MVAEINTSPYQPMYAEFTDTVQDKSPAFIERSIQSTRGIRNEGDNMIMASAMMGKEPSLNDSRFLTARSEASQLLGMLDKKALSDVNERRRIGNQLTQRHISRISRSSRGAFEKNIRQHIENEAGRLLDVRDIQRVNKTELVSDKVLSRSVDMNVANEGTFADLQRGLRDSDAVFDGVDMSTKGVDKDEFRANLRKASSEPRTLELYLAKHYENAGHLTGIRTFPPELSKILRTGKVTDSYKEAFDGLGLSDKEIVSSLKDMKDKITASANIGKPLGVTEEVRNAGRNHLNPRFFTSNEYTHASISGQLLDKAKSDIAESDKMSNARAIQSYTNVTVGGIPVDLKTTAPNLDAQSLRVVQALQKAKLISSFKPSAFEPAISAVSASSKVVKDLNIIDANIKSRKARGISANANTIVNINNRYLEKCLTSAISSVYDAKAKTAWTSRGKNNLMEEKEAVLKSISVEDAFNK